MNRPFTRRRRENNDDVVFCCFYKHHVTLCALAHRPREKVNRPFTRRRRENNTESADKLRMIHENMLHAMEITELMVVRERKKRDIHVSGSNGWFVW